MKKLACWILTLSMALGLLSGCSSPSNNEETSSSGESNTQSEENKQEITGNITVWSWVGDQVKDVMIPAFQKEYPNITVESVNVPNNELKPKLLAALAAGTGAPDVCQVQGDDIVQFIANGGLSDLTDKIAPYVDDFPAFKIANDTDQDGKIYGVPVDSGPCAMFYRTDLFEQAGIKEVPKTWEEFLAAGKQLSDSGFYLHRMASSGDGELLRMLVQQQGSGYFDQDGNVTLDTPEFRKAVQFEIDMFNSGDCVDVSNWTPAYDGEMQGDKLATHIGAAWYMNTFINQWPDAKETWSIAPMPYFEGSEVASSNNGGAELVIPEQSENKDAAWAFVQFYCASVEGRLAAADGMGEFGSYLPAYQEPQLKDATIKYFGDQKVYTFFSEQMELIPSNFYMSPAFMEVNDMIGASLASVVSGGTPIDDFVKDVQNQAKDIAAKY